MSAEVGTVVGLDVKCKGDRMDLKAACECKSIGQIADKFPIEFIKFHKGFTALMNHRFATETKRVPIVHWMCGPTGCGKTRTAVAESLS